MFKKLEGDEAVVASGGVYKPCELYSWENGLYIKLGSGYVRLKADGTTSKDGVALKYLATDRPLFKDRFGRIAISGEKRIFLTDDGKVTEQAKLESAA